MAAAAGALTAPLTNNRIYEFSRRENYIMSTSKNHMEDLTASKTWKAIDRSIKTLDLSTMEEENTAIGGSFVVNLDRLVQVYTAVKPLITVLATIPLLPQAWRAAIAFFNKALDSVVVAVPDFKAGKDL
jgi:hypothetical protein